MANLKSSKKDIRRIAKRTMRNQAAKSQLKTLAKKVRVRGTGENSSDEKSAAIAYVSALDKAVKRGIIHANKARRAKSALSSLIFA
ncbi:MAG: 30S ribosomal protein S20 [Puniceicoccales bacterium]|jgi:small subunit ribosomal protein S20|nr:30S ribosomal protein S20 [Puniceicoccales bacterium]